MKKHLFCRILICILILAFGTWPLLTAQNTIIDCESELGPGKIFADGTAYIGDPGYTFNVIDKELITIRYHTFLSFEDNNTEGINYEMILQIGSSFSKFYSPLLQACDSIVKEGKGFYGGGKIAPRAQLLKNSVPLFINDVYYTHLEDNELSFVCRLATEDYEYAEILPEINWTIYPDKKELCGHLCHRAEGLFRGRIYEAWYSDDIPIPIGPWKLHGLPGVILQARDLEDQCLFYATEIYKGNGIIERPDYPYLSTNRKKYYSMIRSYFRAPQKFISMHLSRAPGYRPTPKAHEEPYRKVVFLEKDI